MNALSFVLNNREVLTNYQNAVETLIDQADFILLGIFRDVLYSTSVLHTTNPQADASFLQRIPIWFPATSEFKA